VGLFKRKTMRRQEPEAEANPRSQAHPMPVEPPPTEPVDAGPEVRPIREPVPVMAIADPAEPVPFVVLPSPATHVASADEQPYDRLDCPGCGTIFRDLPDDHAPCPACGATVHVLTCPEGVRHLLTAADVAAFDDDWDVLHATRRREEARRRNAAAIQARRSALGSYIELGVRLVELRTRPGACAACLAAAAHPYRPRAAPGLPIAGCAHDICRCEYAPARPTSTRR
jgi:hypothetical protein